jgi:hypothetical protein
MSHALRSLSARTGLAALGILALALVAALVLAPRASAWYCAPGTHEFPADSGQCVPDTPTPTTPEAPAPPPEKPEQPAPQPEQPHQPAPPPAPLAPPAPASPPAAVPAPVTSPPQAPAPAPAPAAAPAPTPAPSAAAPEQAVQQEAAEEEAPRPASERPTGAVRGEREEGASAPVAPQPAQTPTQLPFTGLDAGLIASMGLVFLGAGLLLRRQRAVASPGRRDVVASVPGRSDGRWSA